MPSVTWGGEQSMPSNGNWYFSLPQSSRALPQTQGQCHPCPRTPTSPPTSRSRVPWRWDWSTQTSCTSWVTWWTDTGTGRTLSPAVHTSKVSAFVVRLQNGAKILQSKLLFAQNIYFIRLCVVRLKEVCAFHENGLFHQILFSCTCFRAPSPNLMRYCKNCSYSKIKSKYNNREIYFINLIVWAYTYIYTCIDLILWLPFIHFFSVH